MRNIRWYVVGIGSALLWGNLAFAQQAPPVQVIVGPAGIKVIDPRTGKELPCVVTKVANAQPRIQIELDKPGVIELDVQLDAAHKELLRAIMAQKEAEHARKLHIQQLELKLIPGPDGKAVVVAAQPGRPADPVAGMSVDKKIDLLLKQVGELHRDVEAIKRKLDGKPGGPFFEWKLSPKDKDGIRIQFGAGGSEKKEEKGRQSGPNYEKKEEKGKKEGRKGQSNNENEKEEKGKKEGRKGQSNNDNENEEKGKKESRKGQSSNENENDNNRDRDLDRRLERILREAEELRREIRKTKERDKD